MKKVLTIAVVAMLATSMAFAGISGYGQLGYKYDFDSKDTGFTNDTNIKVDVDVVTAPAEAIAEGAVYASISGSFKLWAFNGVKGSASDDPMGEVGRFAISDIKASINGANWSLDLLGMPGRLDLAKSAIDSSTVKYEDDDYGFDKEDYSSAKSYAVSFVKAPGFGFTYNGFTAGLGFFYRDKDADAKDTKVLSYGEKDKTSGKYEETSSPNYVKGTDFAVVVSTPEIAVMDGLTLQAGASYYQNETATLKTTTDKKQKGADSKKLATDRGSAFGGSLAVKYEGDTVSANVSTDLGYKIKHYDAKKEGPVEVEAKEKFGMDIAAQVKVSPVTVDLYYNYDGTQKEAVDANYLSAQVALDMNAFNVPMTLAIYGKDLARPVATAKPIDATATPTIFEKEMDGNKITKGTEYGIKTTVTPVDALELSASFGFNTTSVPNKLGDMDTAKEKKFFSWNASIGATYTMDIATFSGKVSMKNAGFNADDTDLKKVMNQKDSVKAYKDAVNALVLGFEVEAKSTTLIPGAELSLKYAADDVLKSYSDAKIDADELSRLGSLTAKCKVSF